MKPHFENICICTVRMVARAQKVNICNCNYAVISFNFCYAVVTGNYNYIHIYHDCNYLSITGT